MTGVDATRAEEPTDRMTAALRGVLVRFPLAAAGVVAWTAWALWFIARDGGDMLRDPASPTVFLAALAFVGWDAATRLRAERLAHSPRRHWAAKLGGLALTLPALLTGPAGPEILFLAAALVLLVFVAAGPADDGAFWGAGATLVSRMVLAFCVALLLFLGLVLLLVGIDLLIRGMDETMPQASFVLCSCLVAPLFTMATLPAADRMQPAGAERRLLIFLGAAIAVPLCTAYLLLVYVQVARFALGGGIPANATGWLVSAFGTLGIVTWLLVAGCAETGRWRHVRLYRRFFFPALVVPAGVLAYAVQERVAAFGWTPERVALAAVTVWFALSILWWLTRRWTGQGIRAVPALLLLVLATVAVGPLSMTSVADRSQTARLERALDHAGLLVDGRFVPPAAALAPKALAPVAGPLQGLSDLRGEEGVLPFADPAGTPLTVWRLAAALDIGLRRADAVRHLANVDFASPLADGVALPPGAARMQWIRLAAIEGADAGKSPTATLDMGNGRTAAFRLDPAGRALHVDLGGGEVRITAAEMIGTEAVTEADDGKGGHRDLPQRMVRLSGPHGAVDIHLNSARLERRGRDPARLTGIELLAVAAPSDR